MKIYLSGPMSGLPKQNYPAFNDAAKKLRSLRYQVENPAENDNSLDPSWKGCMKKAIKQLVDCDIVLLLPGAFNSKGSCTEVEIAATLGIEIFQFLDFIDAETGTK